MFDPLSHEQLRKVARLQMKDVASRLAERGIALAVTDAALDYVLAESYDPVSISIYLYIYIYINTVLLVSDTDFTQVFVEIPKYLMCLLVFRCMVQDQSGGGLRRRW